MQEEMTKSECLFYFIKEDIDELIKDYMNEYFTRLTIKKNITIKIENEKHFSDLKNKEINSFNEKLFGVNANNFKKEIYSIIINLLNDLYENHLIIDNVYKVFLENNLNHIRIINEEKKNVINIYFTKNEMKKEIEISTDGFGKNEYDKEIFYYGMNEKDYTKINKRFVKLELQRLEINQKGD